MAKNMLGLGLVFTAQDMASAIIRRLGDNLGDLSDKAKKIGAGLGLMYGGMHVMEAGMDLGRGIYSLAQGAGQLEFKLARLRGETKDAAGLANFNEQAKQAAYQAGLTSRANPEEAVLGMREFAKAGLGAKEVFAFLPDALKMTAAAAGEMNVAEVAKYFTQVRAAFSGEVMQPSTALIINATAKAANESLADIAEIPGWISRVVRGSHGMNQEFTDTVALLSRVRQIVTSPETAATSSAMIMQALSGAKKIAKFQDITGVKVTDDKGKFKAVLKIVAEMDESQIWKKLDKGTQTDFLIKQFGSRNVNVIAAVLQELRKGVIEQATGQLVKGVAAAEEILRDYRESASGPEGQRMIDKYTISDITTVGGLMNYIEAKWTTIKTMVGDAFLPALKVVVVFLNDFLFGVGEFIKSLPPSFTSVVAGVVLFGTALFIAAGAVAIMVGAFLVLKTLLMFLWPFLVLGAMALFLPVLKVVAIVSLLIVLFTSLSAGLFAAWKHNIGGIRTLVTEVFEKIKLGAQVLSQLFQKGGTWGDVDKKIMLPENQGLFNFLMRVWMLIGRIKNFLTNMWGGFVEALKSMDGPLLALAQTFRDLFGTFAQGPGTTEENRRAFQNWGETGKIVGKIFAVVANVMILIAALLVRILVHVSDLIHTFAGGESEGFLGFGVRMGAAMNALSEGRGGEGWDLLTDAQKRGSLSERLSRTVLGNEFYEDLDKGAFAYGARSYPSALVGPNAMPARDALAYRPVQAGNASAPVVNVQQPPISIDARVDGKVLFKAQAGQQKRLGERGYQDQPIQGK